MSNIKKKSFVREREREKEIMGEIEEVEAEVRKFLNGGKNNKALKFLLEDPPVTSKDKDLKVRFLVLKSRRFRARIISFFSFCDTLLTSFNSTE